MKLIKWIAMIWQYKPSDWCVVSVAYNFLDVNMTYMSQPNIHKHKQKRNQYIPLFPARHA